MVKQLGTLRVVTLTRLNHVLLSLELLHDGVMVILQVKSLIPQSTVKHISTFSLQISTLVGDVEQCWSVILRSPVPIHELEVAHHDIVVHAAHHQPHQTNGWQTLHEVLVQVHQCCLILSVQLK